MIQQQHITPNPTQEVAGTKKITMPGLSVDVKLALQQYARGSMEERAKGYYESQGMIIPDFNKMSHIERLEALNEYREIAKNSQVELQGFATARAKREDELKLSNLVNKKVDEKLKSKSKPESE